MKSIFGSLDLKDFLKGLVTVIIGSIIAALYKAFSGGTFDFTWAFIAPILKAGIGAGITYLLITWTQNSNGQMFTKETGISLAPIPTIQAMSPVPVQTVTIPDVKTVQQVQPVPAPLPDIIPLGSTTSPGATDQLINPGQ